jgi:hypothetical protein
MYVCMSAMMMMMHMPHVVFPARQKEREKDKVQNPEAISFRSDVNAIVSFFTQSKRKLVSFFFFF